jgi:two-component system sensor histidine kinase SenX3
MGLTHVEQAVVGAAAAVVLLTLFWTWRSRRATARRLSAIATRLERPGTTAESGRGLERLLGRLEKAADDNAMRMSEADAGVHRLTASLERVHDGVVVWDDQGHVVYRRVDAEGDLLEQALGELKTAALRGEYPSQGVDLFGPPARTLVVSAAPLDDGWRTIGAVAVVQDVSERRRVDAVRRDFVANVTHQLKTPIAALGLLAGTLAAEEDVVIARRLAQRMKDESARLAQVFDEMLDLGRVEAEERPVRRPVAIGTAVGLALDRVRPLADRAGVRVEVAEVGPTVEVMGDQAQLVSAVAHLLDNAVKYSAPGGVVHVSAEADEAWVSVLVRDEGLGIPAREVDRVFERFYRAEAGRKHAAGSGLGLSIVRHVAGSHGGAVTVDSEEGEGSTFTLRLPIAVQAARWSAAAS